MLSYKVFHDLFVESMHDSRFPLQLGEMAVPYDSDDIKEDSSPYEIHFSPVILVDLWA